jgi:hypothetical protein
MVRAPGPTKAGVMAKSGGNNNFIDAHSKLAEAEALVARGQRLRLEALTELDAPEVWERDGNRTFAHWVSARLGVSHWLASRLINTAHTLPFLPGVDAAFQDARLGIEKVIELARFATPGNEDGLVKWAESVSPACIRRKADLENMKAIEDATDPDRDSWGRYWWFDEGRRFGLEGEFPADQGAVIAKALDRLADAMPQVIDHDDPDHPEIPREETLAKRRADAIYSMASRGIAEDQDPDRATVVVHADLNVLANGESNCEIENGPVIHPETARRMSCDGRIQFVLHNDIGEAVGIGRADRNPPAWLRRQVRHRDLGCTFPGCGAKRFLHNHHIHHWTKGGPTDLDNLVLVCTFHHKLVHEYGWKVRLGLPGITHWYRPSGAEYLPNRAPPQLALTG